MKKTELKIGNWVIDKEDGMPMQITSGKQIDSIELMAPMPITLDWLLGVGFEENKDFCNWGLPDYTIYSYEGCHIGVKDDEVYWYFSVKDDYYSWTKKLEYVHQFQNLYTALKSVQI
jgi:hypothetical protein